MKHHIDIQAGEHKLALPTDFSIDVDFQNPLFNDVEMFSYPVEIPLEGNRRFVKNIEDIKSDVRTVDLEHTPARIRVDGIPFASGTMRFTDEEQITKSVSMSIDAADQSFTDLIGDLSCRDIPVKDKIKIGEKIGNLYVQASIKSQVNVRRSGSKSKNDYTTYGTVSPKTMANTFEPQALGFSYPAECDLQTGTQKAKEQNTISYKDGKSVVKPKVSKSFINVSAPYGETDSAGRSAYYCNARVCYAHYALDEDGATSSEKEDFDSDRLSEPEYRGAYWVLDADRPQSGICFYMLYFLDCLFDYLNVYFDKSALMDIEDMKHLCFFTTRCAYDVEPKLRGDRYTMSELTKIGSTYYITSTLNKNADNSYSVITGVSKSIEVINSIPQAFHYFYEKTSSDGKNLNSLFNNINDWLSTRGCGGKLSMPDLESKSVNDITYRPYTWVGAAHGVGSSKLYGDPVKIVSGVDGVQSITVESTITSAFVGANIMNMYANSDNFPDASVSDVLSSLENAFGIKFNYDYEQNKVTAFLIRDVFRKPNKCGDLNLNGKVYDITKISEKITGVRHCYSGESDSKEQAANVKNGVKDYDTDYDYIEYPDPEDTNRLASQCKTIYDKSYGEFFSNLSNSDMNVYIDKRTGNAYRIKIDSDFTDTASMKPALFEVGQWKGIEYGDCSKQNDDFVKEFSIGFTPITFNDVNYRLESASTDTFDSEDASELDGYDGIEAGSINSETNQPLLAAFVDDDMEHEFVEHNIDNLLSCSVADVLVRETLSLVENYDPSNTDDGNSPLQTHDWGMAIALMRGGGSDMTLQEYDYNFDGFGNSKYRTVAGMYALCSDTMDAWGNTYDYNGSIAGDGDGERFSLKVNADKSWLASWARDRDIDLIEDDVKDANGNITTKIKSRGLFQSFMVDYAYFLVNRKKYAIKAIIEPAQLVDIVNHWNEWWNIDGNLCLIDKIQCSIKNDTGMGECSLEVYCL